MCTRGVDVELRWWSMIHSATVSHRADQVSDAILSPVHSTSSAIIEVIYSKQDAHVQESARRAGQPELVC